MKTPSKCEYCEYRRFLARHLDTFIDEDNCHVKDCPYEFGWKGEDDDDADI